MKVKALLLGISAFVANANKLSPLIPVLKMAVDLHGGPEVKATIEAIAAPAACVISKARKALSLKSQLGIQLLDLKPEQQEIVAQMKEGRKVVCLDTLQNPS